MKGVVVMKKTKKTRGLVELKSRYGFFFTLHWIIGIVIFFAVPLIQSIIFSLTLVIVSNINIIPSINTAHKANCQLYPIPNTTVYAKNALSPIPGASAIG